MQYKITKGQYRGRYRFQLMNAAGDIVAVSPVRGFATYAECEAAALSIRDDSVWTNVSVIYN